MGRRRRDAEEPLGVEGQEDDEEDEEEEGQIHGIYEVSFRIELEPKEKSVYIICVELS